jgi:hypothetical protein
MEVWASFQFLLTQLLPQDCQKRESQVRLGAVLHSSTSPLPRIHCGFSPLHFGVRLRSPVFFHHNVLASDSTWPRMTSLFYFLCFFVLYWRTLSSVPEGSLVESGKMIWGLQDRNPSLIVSEQWLSKCHYASESHMQQFMDWTCGKGHLSKWSQSHPRTLYFVGLGWSADHTVRNKFYGSG